MELTYIVRNNDKYITVNDVLKKHFCISNRLLTKIIKNHQIYLNNSICDTRNTIKNGDKIVVKFDDKEDNSNIVAKKMDLEIIYEDAWFLVINKPAGIAIHPSILHYDNSLSNGVKYYFDTIGLSKKIRIINRLDKNTSGIVVFAKCEYIQEAFSKQMQEHKFIKNYLAVVHGTFDKKQGIISLPISRKEGSIIERCVDFEKGQPSITYYEVIKEVENKSLVKCTLETGRTHQIRVHMSYLNHPLLGDTLYGNKSDSINRQALHCYEIKMIHPITLKLLKFNSNLPSDIKKLI